MKKVFLLLFLFEILKSQTPILDSLKFESKHPKHDTIKCSLLVQMIEEEVEDSIWVKYNHQLNSIALQGILKTKNNNIKNVFGYYLATSFNNFGYYYSNIGNDSLAILNYTKSISIFSIIDNVNEKCQVYLSLGNLFKKSGEYDRAIETYNDCLFDAQRINDSATIAMSYYFLGFVYDYMGDIPNSLSSYHKALKVQEKLTDKKGYVLTLNNIASLFKNRSEYEKALEYYQKCLKINIEINNQVGISAAYNNIGNTLYNQGSFEKAKEFFLKALDGFTEINYQTGVAFALNNIGNIEFRTGNYGNALKYYNESLSIREKNNDLFGIAATSASIGEVYEKNNDLKNAMAFSEKSLKIAKAIENPDAIKTASAILFKIYDKCNETRKALEAYQLYIKMRDTLNNIESQKVLITQSTKYEYEKKVAADSVRVVEEKKVTTAQLKQEKTQRFALYGGIVFIGLFGLFMFNRFKVTKKQNELIQVQKAELQLQKELVEEHQKETLDSIHYAKRIQTALIANSDFITQHVPENFIYFNPKDIVSGDFYWATKHNNKFYLAVCDSTGHGVPGAFMSLLNMGFLSEAIKEKNIEKPNEVFNYVRERLISSISDGGQKDGMDGILICIDSNNTKTITYAAANNEPILIRDNAIIELPKDKMPVGKGEKTDQFSLHSVELQEGDTLYLYTDGYADQFGGPKGKKFKYKQLNELLLTIKDLPLNEQKDKLESGFTNWKGNQEQVDDVLIIGIKI